MELLKELYGISARTHQEKDMIAFVSQRLSDLGVTFTVDETGNIYATKGNADTYPCIAAHLDEVHEAREKVTKSWLSGMSSLSASTAGNVSSTVSGLMTRTASGYV